jgi:hypothetical protein
MENILTNMSIGGVVVVLLTTLKVILRRSLINNAPKTSLLIQVILHKSHQFLQRAYKSLTLCILSAFVLFVCYKITRDQYMTMWVSAVIAGVLSIGLSAVLKSGMYWIRMGVSQSSKGGAIRIVLDEKHIGNGGTLFISLVSLLIVLLNYQAAYTWNAFTVMSLAASFAIGASGLLLCMHMYECFSGYAVAGRYSTSSARMLSNDRFDALMGTLVAAMLLGTTMCEINSFQRLWLPAGPVVLPLLLTISGVGISSVAATLAKIKGWEKEPVAYLTEKMVSALLMIVAAFVITQYLLPAFWVRNGTEYTSMQVFYAAQAGIIGGLLTNKVIQAYYALHRKYFAYLAKKSFSASIMDTVFHFFINTISTCLPVIFIVLSIVFSYKLVGLYGIVIALVAMLANISTQLTTRK